MSPEEIQARKARLQRCNQLLFQISDCGRRFFYSNGFVAYLEIDDNHRVWFHDDYSRKRIYTHRAYLGRGFTHGGTLNSLVRWLRHYIITEEDRVKNLLGPWPEHICHGDLWGYGDDMVLVRTAWESGNDPTT